MGYFTNEDFDLLAKWGGKKYDAQHKEHREAQGKLEPIKEKINVLADKVSKGFINQHNVVTRHGSFCRFHRAQYYPREKSALGISIVINLDKKFVIHFFPQRKLMSEEACEKFDKLMKVDSSLLSYEFDSSEIINLDKDALLAKTQECFDKLLQEFDEVYKDIVGSEPTT